MPARHRDASEWIVHGRKQSQPWVILVFVVLIGVLVVLAYQRFMAFDTVSYEVRSCQSPLTAESSWADVQAAGCEPVTGQNADVVVYEGTSRHEPASVEGGTFTFDDFPVNSTSHSVELRGVDPAGSVLIVEPTNERIRRAMSGDASGTSWTGFIGDRGPTEYWLLLTP